MLQVGDRAMGHDRTNECVVRQRIPDADIVIGTYQATDQLVPDGGVHDDPTRGGAALARGPA